MKIVMKESVPGSADGINTSVYEAGLEYDLSGTAGERDLASALVGAGFAEEVGATAALSVAATQVDPGKVEAPSAADAPAAPAKPGRKPKPQ